MKVIIGGLAAGGGGGNASSAAGGGGGGGVGGHITSGWIGPGGPWKSSPISAPRPHFGVNVYPGPEDTCIVIRHPVNIGTTTTTRTDSVDELLKIIRKTIELHLKPPTKLERARNYAAAVQTRWLKEGRIAPIINRSNPDESNPCDAQNADERPVSR